MQLDGRWDAVWDHGTHDEERLPDLLCPHHARNEQVLRPEGFALVGDAEVSLQELDYIGTRPPDIFMFKHVVLEAYWLEFEHLADVVTQMFQLTAAVGAVYIVRCDRLRSAGKMQAKLAPRLGDTSNGR